MKRCLRHIELTALPVDARRAIINSTEHIHPPFVHTPSFFADLMPEIRVYNTLSNVAPVAVSGNTEKTSNATGSATVATSKPETIDLTTDSYYLHHK